LPRSGVENPVTAVILNYRVYDTFLEIGVVFLVILAVFALQPEQAPPILTKEQGQSDPILRSYARGILPLMVLTAGYLLWAGAFRPGGAFQAGSILGGAGILLLLSRPTLVLDLRSQMLRIFLGAGVAAFGLLGLLSLFAGRGFLAWPLPLAKYAILFAETAATLSIGLTLMGLYAAVTNRLVTPAKHASMEERGK
jgi:multisubunit Na+/H+ antiporter MnhB subunit